MVGCKRTVQQQCANAVRSNRRYRLNAHVLKLTTRKKTTLFLSTSSLGPRPSPYVRVLICGGGNNAVKTGKALGLG